MKLSSVGLCVKSNHPEAGGAVRGLEKWLAGRGLDVSLDENAAELVGCAGRSRAEVAEEVDLLVVLGGDGTLLSVARATGRRPVPILGVNLGTLGFLTEVTHDELFAALERVLAGDVHIDSRMRLDVRVERDGQLLGSYLALNDAVITSLSLARMINLDAMAGDLELTRYHADGLIASTPTGSTAYSLSAGGPILDAGLDAVVLTPISPHTLTQRPLVLHASCEIRIRAYARGGGIQLTVDGQDGEKLQDGDTVRVVRSEHPVQLVASPFRNRFEVLRTKLHWGER